MTISFASFYLGANHGYTIGYKTAIANKTVVGIKNGKVECHYIK